MRKESLNSQRANSFNVTHQPSQRMQILNITSPFKDECYNNSSIFDFYGQAYFDYFDDSIYRKYPQRGNVEYSYQQP